MLKRDAQQGYFQVRFDQVHAPGIWGKFQGLFAQKIQRLEPYHLRRVLQKALAQSRLQGVEGEWLVPHNFLVLLSPKDHISFKPFSARFLQNIRHLFDEQVKQLKARAQGPWIIQIQALEGLPKLQGEIHISFKQERLSLPSEPKISAPKPPLERQLRSKARVSPEAPIRILWDGGEFLLHPGTRRSFGRPCEGIQDYISLSNASAQLSKEHFWIDHQGALILLGIGPEVSPVSVDGAQLSPGTESYLQLPTELEICCGAFKLRLEFLS